MKTTKGSVLYKMIDWKKEERKGKENKEKKEERKIVATARIKVIALYGADLKEKQIKDLIETEIETEVVEICCVGRVG